jgi:hypothetical protein
MSSLIKIVKALSEPILFTAGFVVAFHHIEKFGIYACLVVVISTLFLFMHGIELKYIELTGQDTNDKFVAQVDWLIISILALSVFFIFDMHFGFLPKPYAELPSFTKKAITLVIIGIYLLFKLMKTCPLIIKSANKNI